VQDESDLKYRAPSDSEAEDANAEDVDLWRIYISQKEEYEQGNIVVVKVSFFGHLMKKDT
jgi:hypothetical protein